MKALAIVAALIAAVSSCDRPASATERGAVRGRPATSRRTVIDSALPPAELLRRFRVGVDSPAHLDGANSRDALVQAFFTAVRRRDRSAIERLGMNRAEFAWLLFPGSRQSLPPYNQPPDVAWLLLSARSDGSLTKLLAHSSQFELRGYSCMAAAEHDGAATYLPGCTVRVRENGADWELRLFGSIVEQRGRFKFYDFANGF